MIAGISPTSSPTISSESTNSVSISQGCVAKGGGLVTAATIFEPARIERIMMASCMRPGAWLIAAAVAVCLVVGSTSADASDLQRVRVGLRHTPGAGPLFIAAERYFAGQGLDARIEFLPSDTLVATRVASGDLDIGLAEFDAALFGYATKHQLVAFASEFSDQTGYPANALLISNKAHEAGFRTARDLPHRRIGMTTPGTGVRYSLQRVAVRYGLDPNSIEKVWLKTYAGEVAALARGEIDAAILPFEMALTLRQAGKGASIIRLSDLNEWQEGVVFSRKKTIDTRRGAIAAFIRGYQLGAAEYDLTFQQRGDDGHVLPGPRYTDDLALIGHQAKVSPTLLERTLRYCDRLARLDVTDVGRQLEFWQDLGFVDKQVTPAEVLDLSFIDQHIK
jgi:NitT/TauT family transport system substrate-binding protein